MKNGKIRNILLSALLGGASLSTSAQEPVELKLWPDTDEATITVFAADKAKNQGVAVLICPGGGYSHLALQHEGSDFGTWLSANGITGIVLKYRMPAGRHELPLADAKKAMEMIRENATAWNINPDKIGVMGFSAGGHLASTLLTRFDAASRPAFGILFYPVITFDGQYAHRGSAENLLGKNASRELTERYCNEKHVTSQTPPTLLLHSDDDGGVPPQNSVMFYNALKDNGLRASLHIFPSGGHGWGFRDTFAYHCEMMALVLDWIGVCTR